MGRTYKRAPGIRRYKDYNDESLQNCLKAIKAGMSQRQAADAFIPRKTLYKKLKSRHQNNLGYPSIFSQKEEDLFVSNIVTMSDYGFPLTADDLRSIVSSYLNKSRRTVSKFKNNLPGQDWVISFLLRHTMLSTRFVANIKNLSSCGC